MIQYGVQEPFVSTAFRNKRLFSFLAQQADQAGHPGVADLFSGVLVHGLFSLPSVIDAMVLLSPFTSARSMGLPVMLLLGILWISSGG